MTTSSSPVAGVQLPQPHDLYSTMHSSQFAGTSNVYPMQNYNQDTWISSTGAMNHITPFVNHLNNAVPFTSTLHLPNGATAEVISVGTVMLSSDIVLQNVLCVPEFSYNLLSISKLLIDTEC